MKNQPIGLMDSGIGGLTVAKELMKQLPQESFIYFGDTARCPYGNKSAQEIIEIGLEVAKFLEHQQIKFLIIACNTVTAQGLTVIEKELSIPVLGVIEAGAMASTQKSSTQHVAIVATKSTIESGAYERKIHEYDPQMTVGNYPRQEWVEWVESGLYQSDIIDERLDKDLEEIRLGPWDTLILGCTHFPYLQDKIAERLPDDLKILDPSVDTIKLLKNLLEEKDLQNNSKEIPSFQFITTGHAIEFKEIVREWLEIEDPQVKSIKLEELGTSD